MTQLAKWMLIAFSLFFTFSGSANAATWREPLRGWYVAKDDDGPAMILESPNAAASEYCTRGKKLGLARMEGNSQYCYIDDGYGHMVEHYAGSVRPWSSCPEDDPEKSNGNADRCYLADEKKPDCDCTPNPVRIASREKIRVESDYVGPHGLDFVRHYSSNGTEGNWRHTYSRRFTANWIRVDGETHDISRAYVWDPIRKRWSSNGGMSILQMENWVTILGPDGYGYATRGNDTGSVWTAEADGKHKLAVDIAPDGKKILSWRLTTPSDDVEIYNGAGRLVQIRFLDGRVHTLTYSDAGTPPAIAPAPGLLIKVADNFGRSLQLRYNSARQLIAMIDPAGGEYGYTYEGVTNLITSVTHPDGMKRVYHYHEPEHVTNSNPLNHFLTGISDEISPGNLLRYATYKWDKDEPLSTEQGGGAEKFTFDFAEDKITDPLGAVRKYYFATINGRKVQHGILRPDGKGGSFFISHTYDENGNIRVRRDDNDVPTVIDYDLTRNLEIKRVEASGLPSARTISTKWHPTLRLPVDIAAPLLRTKMKYDAAGHLTSKTEQATTDSTGASGFSATLTGPVRSWTYTYTATGLLRTARGPRTDVDDTVTYEYDTAGNLTKITNAAKHVTQLLDYDANGRAGRIIDANNLQTVLKYSLRGWLTSSQRGDELTTYDYDGVGHVTRVTQPNGTVLDYGYDVAQRLTSITDNLGNSVEYTLDPAGNRTGEAIRDPNGTLARQITRVYDVLGRVKQVTGATQ